MNDVALLQELYRLGEADAAGVSVPHHVTILRGPRPSPVQLDGLAEISALVSRAVLAGEPVGNDGTRLFEDQIILRSCAPLSRSAPGDRPALMDGLSVSADGGTYSTPTDSSHDETSVLEAWWRKIDAPEVQDAAPTEAVLKGLMNIGHQGHPIPSSTVHWHLDTADRAPSRVRIDNAERKASRLAIAQADQRAANATASYSQLQPATATASQLQPASYSQPAREQSATAERLP
jgi:hypothetical protein